jgi:hypothetical protein
VGASSLLPARMWLRCGRQRIVFGAEDPRDLVVISFFSRVLSVFRGQLSHVWTVLVFSLLNIVQIFGSKKTNINRRNKREEKRILS